MYPKSVRGNHGETTVDPEQCTFHSSRNMGVISPICGCDGYLTTLGDTSSNSLPSTVFTKMSVVILTASYYKGYSICMFCVEAFAIGIKIESSVQSPF